MLLARFHHLYPRVRFTCKVSPQPDSLRSLAEGESHFALFSFDKDSYPDLEIISYFNGPIVLIAPIDHPWARRGEIAPADLLEGDFIVREPESGTFKAVSEALAGHHISISDLHTLITLGNAEAIALAVQEGIGVGFISKIVIDRLCSGKVAEVRIRGIDISRQIYFGRSSRRPATRAQTAFWEFIRTTNPEILVPA